MPAASCRPRLPPGTECRSLRFRGSPATGLGRRCRGPRALPPTPKGREAGRGKARPEGPASAAAPARRGRNCASISASRISRLSSRPTCRRRCVPVATRRWRATTASSSKSPPRSRSTVSSTWRSRRRPTWSRAFSTPNANSACSNSTLAVRTRSTRRARRFFTASEPKRVISSLRPPSIPTSFIPCRISTRSSSIACATLR